MLAYQLAFCRPPDDSERQAALDFLGREQTLIRARQLRKEPILPPVPMPAGQDAAAGSALVDLCHVLLNANEFLYVE